MTRRRFRAVAAVIVASLALPACAIDAQGDPELIPSEEVPFDLSGPSTTATSTTTTTTTTVSIVPPVGD